MVHMVMDWFELDYPFWHLYRQIIFILRIKKLQNIIKCVHFLEVRFNRSTRDAYFTKILKFGYKTDHKRLGTLLIWEFD